MGHAIINLQAITALSFLLIFILRTRRHSGISATLPLPVVASVLAVLVLPSILFWRTLDLPFIHDACVLVYLPSRQTLADILRLLRPPPVTPDLFFRPMAYLAFWAYGKWAKFEPWRWHLWCITVHLLNSLLVYVLTRRLRLKTFPALVAALLFAVHGTRAEAVAWPAVRVDLLATFFVLLTLLAVDKLTEGGSRWWYLAIVFAAAAACLSKEAAYSLPLIAWVMLLARHKGRHIAPVAALFAICAICFCYRFWVLGGIGGYSSVPGVPNAANHFSLVRALSGLFYREWGFFFFPVNWSEAPGLLLWLGLFGMVAALLLLVLVWPTGDRRLLLTFLLLTLVAAAPAFQLLTMGADLGGARVLYLPVLGVALFWGAAIDGMVTVRRQMVIAVALLGFQTTALVHNLNIWTEVSTLAARSDRYIAQEWLRGSGPMAVENLPASFKGVFFLKNVFPECVLLNSGGLLGRDPDIREVPVSAPLTDFTRAYRWNTTTLQFDRLK